MRAAGVLRADPVTAAAAAALALLGAVALAASWIVPFDPLATDVAAALRAPSAAHWCGTDQLGRDVLSRVLAAGRLDGGIALAAVALSVAVGGPAGAACGYAGGRLDRWVGRLADALMALPLFVVAMALAAALGRGAGTVVLATAVINVPLHLRVARVEVGQRRGLGWVEAARACGDGPVAVVLGTLLPNAAPAMAVQASLNLGWAMLNAAGLSFLGLGVAAPAPEWGIMVADGARLLSGGAWWLVAGPGVALAGTVLCLNLVGDGLRDWLEPGAPGLRPGRSGGLAPWDPHQEALPPGPPLGTSPQTPGLRPRLASEAPRGDSNRMAGPGGPCPPGGGVRGSKASPPSR